MQSAGCLKWLNIKKLGDIDMQQLIATESVSTASAAGMSFPDITPIPDQDPRYAQYKVIRRNGRVVVFEPAKISLAMTRAYITGVY